MKMLNRIAVAILLMVNIGLAPRSAVAQKWADLSMTIVLDGPAPPPKTLKIAAGGGGCAIVPNFTEDLVANPDTNGIANVVFMIDTKKTKLANDQLHPDLQKVPETKPVLDNLNCRFEPHVLSMRAGQTLTVKNSDLTAHNANLNFFNNQPVNPLIPVGGMKDVFTTTDEKAPIPVDCNIHPWMKAFIIVTDHPYVGISDAAGKIKIEKLPAGIPLDFRIWHESQDKSIEEVNLAGKKVTWKKGSTSLTLKEGANNLGTLLIKPDRFKE